MTRVLAETVIASAGKKEYRSILANGHATGEPEACAGISALLYALAGWASNRDIRQHGENLDVCIMSDGFCYIGLAAESEAEAAAVTAVWNMTVVGLLQIEKKYPEAIQVSFDADSDADADLGELPEAEYPDD